MARKKKNEPRIIGNTVIPPDLPAPSPGRDLPFEDKLHVATLICDIYAETRFTLDSILSEFGIRSHATFLKWRKEINEIDGLFKEAVKLRTGAHNVHLKELARTSLEKALTGDVVTLRSRKIEPVYKRDENGDLTEVKVGDLVVEETIREVFVRPNVTAIIFTLTNRDGTNFKRDPSVDPERGKTEFEDWTEEQLDKELNRLHEQIGHHPSEDPDVKDLPGEA